jgi:PAS domain S-box-containing protein
MNNRTPSQNVILFVVASVLIMLVEQRILLLLGLQVAPEVWLKLGLSGLTLAGTLGLLLSWRPAQPPLARFEQAESFASAVISVLTDGVIVIDACGKIRLFSPAAEKLFGYAKEEVLGRNLNMLMPEPNFSAHDAHLRRYQTTKEPRVIGFGRILNALKKDGRIFPIRLSVGELSDQGQQFFVGITSDYSTQQAAELKITQLVRAIDASADSIYVTDRDGRIEFANAAFCSMIGVTPQEVIGLSPRDVESQDMPATIRQSIWETLGRGEPWRGRILNRRKSGADASTTEETFWTESTIAPIQDTSNMVVGYVSTQQDISEKVRFEQEEIIARESAELRAKIGTILQATQPLREKLGQTLALVVDIQGLKLQQKGGIVLRSEGGKPLALPIVHGELSQEFVGREPCAVIEGYLRGGEEQSGEPSVSDNCFCDLLHQQGFVETQPHAHYIVPLTSAREILGVMFLYADSNPRRDSTWIETLRLIGEMMGLAIANSRLQQQMAASRDAAIEAGQAKSQFLANMSHEIRTPMNGILGMLDLLRDARLTRQYAEFLEVAYQSAISLLDILNDILDYSKIEAGKLDIEHIDFDIQQLVDDLGGIFAEPADKKGLELICYVDPTVPRIVQGDPTRLRQILSNLLSNAIKFTEHGEVAVTVTTECESNGSTGLRFNVRDSGIGISAKAKDKLFQSFVQADGSTTRKYGGTGLGLAICKQLVELMGGQINASSWPGKGSTFWFTLTLAHGNPNLHKFPGVAPSTIQEGIRVLVVDDNATNRQILEHYLRSWNMNQDDAENGTQGLEKLRQAAEAGQPFSAAIIDMAMPEMDGLELARHVKGDSLLASTRLVMLSSIGIGTCDALEVGIDQVLMKPVRQSALFDALISALHHTIQYRGTTEIGPKARSFEGRILLVEDNRVNQIVLEQLLLRCGLTPDIANNGREALEWVACHTYDLIFMDCQMPEMDGYETTREMRRQEAAQHLARQTIVALTAGAMQEDRELCLAAGMDDYVAKPVTREALTAALEKWFPAMQTAAASAADTQQPSSKETTFPPQVTEDEVPIDRATIDGLQRVMGTEFKTLVTAFLDSTPASLEELRLALAEGDPTRQHRAAHAVKSTSALLGALSLAKLFGEAEALARKGIMIEQVLFDQILHEFKRTRRFLEPLTQSAI